MYGTMTLVAAGWPTTFCARIAVRFSAASGVCFLALAPEGDGLGRSTILYSSPHYIGPRGARGHHARDSQHFLALDFSSLGLRMNALRKRSQSHQLRV